jgi:hypothetical protein
MTLRPRISFVTLGVDDLARALEFYRKWMQLPEELIRDGGDHVAVTLEGGSSLVLYPRSAIARVAGDTSGISSSSEMVLSQEADSPAEVQNILMAGVAAGGKQPAPVEVTEWGASGYLLDPDGHLWEIVSFKAE